MFMQKKIYILLHVYTPDIRTNLYNTCLALHQGVVITYLFWVYIYSTQYTTSSERGWAWRSPNKKTTCLFRPWDMKTFGQIIYSDFTRPHSKWWFFCKGNLLFQGNQGWWNMCNLARNMFSKGTFGGIFRVHLGPNISITHAGGLIWYVLGVCFFFVVFCRVKDESLTAFDPCERWWILQPCHCYV